MAIDKLLILLAILTCEQACENSVAISADVVGKIFDLPGTSNHDHAMDGQLETSADEVLNLKSIDPFHSSQDPPPPTVEPIKQPPTCK